MRYDHEKCLIQTSTTVTITTHNTVNEYINRGYLNCAAKRHWNEASYMYEVHIKDDQQIKTNCANSLLLRYMKSMPIFARDNMHVRVVQSQLELRLGRVNLV